MTGPDPFGTASVRERVLAAWAATPARLREDANAEEDFSLGGYRDRVVVELAQNAADAALAAGEPGRLRLSLTAWEDGEVLSAANTGRPLDAEGVAALATLRASAKRDLVDDVDPLGAVDEVDDVDGLAGARRSVGRFGVGFAAVLSLTDEPMLLSRNGSVRFSRADTVEAVHALGVPGLDAEVRRRDGHLPALRLPFEAEGEPPQGYSTVVLLPLRDEAAADLARRLLDEVDDALLLALPGLLEVEIEVDGRTRVLRDAGQRWHTAVRSGTFDRAERRDLFADRPTEESHRPWWSVLWALPRGPQTAVPPVVHAPTPTDEPLAWPALLLASFPLEPSRRHVAPGPLADRIVAEAATAYAELLTARAAAGDDVLGLVPVGLGAGAVDAALRLASLDALASAPILRAVEDGTPLRPRDAVTIDGATPESLRALAPYVAGLVDAPSSGRTALRQLGTPSLPLAEVIEALPLADDPGAWARRYAALAPLADTPEGREALAVLPVPLADGRVVRGARGALLPPAGMTHELVERLAAAGVRLVDPEAAHDLLARLGALPASPREVLADPAVRELVETSPEADDPDEVAVTVLGLVEAALAAGGPDALSGPAAEGTDLAWLGDLALPDQDDELAPAAVLALPGSPATEIFDPDEIGIVDAGLVERWGAATLRGVGVLSGFGLVRADEVDLSAPPERLEELDGFTDWADQLRSGLQDAEAGELAAGELATGEVVAGEVVAVRDLDVVRTEAWAAAVATLAARPDTRAALVDPVRLRDARGRGRDVPSYTSWWLRRELGLGSRPDPEAEPALLALLDPAPDWVSDLDDEVRRVLGVVRHVEDLPASAAGLVLARLAEDDREVELPALLRVWAWLAALPPSGSEPAAPGRVRALTPTGLRVVPSIGAVVCDEPMWLQRNDIGAFVIAPPGHEEALADQLDLDLASERATGRVTSTGVDEPVPSAVRRVLPDGPRQWRRHERLEVDGLPVAWWVDAEGRPHAGEPAGLAAALSWAARRWSQRLLVGQLLADHSRTDALLAESAFE